MIYRYEWYHWITFFFLYSFFGWIIESAYVSLLKKRFVNRGFLRLPLLPLYGTGAVMMLWVTLPFRDNLVLIYLSGMVAATLLEYVTGAAMERLFKVRYWDYSNQKRNLNGYICLSSSVAWGFLTILMTQVLHRPVERFVLGLPRVLEFSFLAVVGMLFISDAVRSVKEALDLAQVLETMTTMRAELDDLQVQAALLKAETTQRVEELREESLARIRLANRSRLTALTQRMNVVTENRHKLSTHLGFYQKSILRGNPTATSARFADALRELREAVENRKH